MFGFDLPQVGAAITISAIAADATGYVHFIRNINDLLDLYKPAAVMSAIILSRNSLIEVIELRVFVPRSRRKSSVGRRGRGALLGAGRIWKFQAGGSEVEAAGAGEMV